MQFNSSDANIWRENNKKAVDICSKLLDMPILSIAFFIGEEEYRIDYTVELAS